MKLVTFTGETPAEALKKAQEQFGDDALVVNTKQVRKKTLTTTPLFEVVVAIQEEVTGASVKERLEEKSKATSVSVPPPSPYASSATNLPKNDKPKVEHQAQVTDGKDILLGLKEAANQISKIAQVEEETLAKDKSVVAKKSLGDDDLGDIKHIKEVLAKLSDKVKLIQESVWESSEHLRAGLSIPPEFAEIYRIASESGMDNEHLDQIMRLTLEHMPSTMRQSSETVKRYFHVLMRKMIPIRHEMKLPNASKKVIMFVGPTGVGKTTTLAKMAGRFAFAESNRYKVGIITLDVYRIGAVEQLLKYAQMMRLPIETVEHPADLAEALTALRHCDYIFIDTVGSSQHDKEQIAKLHKFVKADKNTAIDVNLVISATTKLDDLRDIYRNFSPLGVDTLIFTKMDESKTFGNIFSLVYETAKPMSYLSVGQEVPNDLIEADSNYFLECLFEGFKEGRHVR